jgi:hypothetical protein
MKGPKWPKFSKVLPPGLGFLRFLADFRFSGRMATLE